jgi:hypothetical protein
MMDVMGTYPFKFQIAGTDIILLGPAIARIVLKVNWDTSLEPNSDERVEVARRTNSLLKYMALEGMVKPKSNVSFEVVVIN